MCSHVWKKYEDCWYCAKCGMIRLPTGQIYFDRKLPNYKRKKRKTARRVESDKISD